MSKFQQGFLILAVTIGYAGLGLLASRLAIPPGNVTAFWPASGFALGMVMRFGWVCLPGVFLGNILANLPAFFDASTLETLASSVATSIGIAGGDVGQTALAVWLIHGFLGRNFVGFRRSTDVLKFVLIVAISHLLSPSMGVLSLVFGKVLPVSDGLYTWVTWYIGDSLGCLFLWFLVLNWHQDILTVWREQSIKTIGLVMIPALCFYLIQKDPGFFALIYVFPISVFFVLRLPASLVSILDLLMVLSSIFALIHRPTSTQLLNSQLISIQSFMFAFYLMHSLVTAFKNERETMQKDLDEARATSLQNSKLAAIGEMAGGIAHEINNPLAIIRGESEIIIKLLEREHLQQSPVYRRAEAIVKTSDRVNRIIKGMLALSVNMETVEEQDFTLDEIFTDILSLSAEKMKHHGIDFKIEGDLMLRVKANKVQLGQVFVNLINNSVDAIHESSAQPAWICIKVQPKGDFVEIHLENSGPAIAEEISHRIFEPFFTTKKGGRGTGIGLSISRKIVESLGGRLELNPTVPQVSFRMTLRLFRKI